jgi:hypothetical protein
MHHVRQESLDQTTGGSTTTGQSPTRTAAFDSLHDFRRESVVAKRVVA